MREFARLYAELDETTATNRKLEALQNYFGSAAPGKRRVGGVLPGRRQAAPGGADQAAAPVRDRIRAAGRVAVRRMLQAVGDLAETIAHILPPPSARAMSAWPSGCRSASVPCAAPTR
jgi:DNA ligase-1